MKKLFLVDAYALIFKYYYAFLGRPMRNREGMNTSVVFGFVKFLRDIQKRERPDLLGVAFDPKGGSFRRDIFPEYKANRSETPEDILLSIPYVKRVLDAMCIPILEAAGYEADDVIGTLSQKGVEAGYDVYMVTPDKDYGQLVRDNCRIYKQRGAEGSIEIVDREAIREKYGIERVIKLASNENPLGTSPLVQHTLETHVGLAFRYPQAGNPRLVKAIAAHHGVSPSRVIVGDGSDEVIDLLFRICVEPGVNNAVAFMPCFGIYTTQAALCGVELRQTPVNADFSFPWDNLLKLVDDKTSLVFVTTPDNPSGYTPPVAELETLAKALPDTCLLVLDEAYIDFADGGGFLPRLGEFPNLIVLQTLSKAWGMAGLRLGLAFASERIAALFGQVKYPYNINTLTQQTAAECLRRDIAAQVAQIREERGRLAAALAGCGCIERVYPSQANFLLVKTADPDRLYGELIAAGVIVRNRTRITGCEGCLRITVGTPAENGRMLETVKNFRP